MHALVLRAPPAPPAELVDLALDAGAREPGAGEAKLPVQLQALDDGTRAGRDEDGRPKADLSRHHRRVALHRELQEVLDAAAVHRRVQRDGAPVHAHPALHFAPHVDRRGGQPRAHRVQVGVAVGAVHARLELGVERERAGGRVEREVGRVGRARHEDLLEHAGEAPGGRERPAETLDCAEVGLLEDVGAAHRQQAGVVRHPRADTPARVDDALRYGVGENGLEVERFVEPDVPDVQRRNRKAPRLLVRVARHQLDLGARRRQPLDQHPRRTSRPSGRRVRRAPLTAAPAPLGGPDPGILRLWRDCHPQALEPHVAQAPWPSEHVAPRGGRREARDDDERRHTRPAAAHQRQAAPLDSQPGQQRHAQLAQAHLGIEPVGERPLDPAPDAFVTRKESHRCSDEQDENDGRCAGRPSQDRAAARSECGGHLWPLAPPSTSPPAPPGPASAPCPATRRRA